MDAIFLDKNFPPYRVVFAHILNLNGIKRYEHHSNFYLQDNKKLSLLYRMDKEMEFTHENIYSCRRYIYLFGIIWFYIIIVKDIMFETTITSFGISLVMMEFEGTSHLNFMTLWTTFLVNVWIAFMIVFLINFVDTIMFHWKTNSGITIVYFRVILVVFWGMIAVTFLVIFKIAFLVSITMSSVLCNDILMIFIIFVLMRCGTTTSS